MPSENYPSVSPPRERTRVFNEDNIKTPIPSAPKPPTEISEALNEQFVANKNLHETIDRLEKMLEPVLSASNPEKATAETGIAYQSPLGTAIGRSYLDINHSAQRLGRLMDRIKL